tara:strand:+ start:1362 stop:2363 length:1002 start_codon:yes stop_codon:yes gene_type:complete
MIALLTGGNGYIGSHITTSLIDSGHKVVIFDNFSNSKPDVIKNLIKITNENIPIVEGDIRDTSLLSKTIKEYNIQIVIHLAGLKVPYESQKKAIEYFDINVNGTLSVLRAMIENNIKKIIFSSSAAVYGNPLYLPIDENHLTEPVNTYGLTKLHAEQILHQIYLSDKYFSIICLRYFNPVGAHDSCLIGENSKNKYTNLMPLIAQVASKSKSKLLIYGNDYPTIDGTGVRDFIHILDLAEGHLAAFNYLKQSKGGFEVINLGTGYGISVMQMINQFALSSSNIINYEFSGRRHGDVAESYASVDKAKKILKWEAKRNIELMCTSAWKWQELIK